MTREQLLQDGFSPETFQFLEEQFQSPQFRLIPLAGDASARRYFRVVHQADTFVLMVWEPFDSIETYPFLNVQKHFMKHHVTVPTVKAVAPELGLVLLEDLGDLTLERKFWENQDQTQSWPYYEQALDELIKIHFKASMDKGSNCSAFHVAFDTEKLLWEMNYGREHLFERFLKLSFTPTETQDLQACFLDICETLHKEPKFISHRDYHSRNVMITLGKARVIDFQDARMGPIQYDLVSLLQDSYVQLSTESRQHLLEKYLEKARPHLPTSFSRTHFDTIYRLQIIQRCFKACGSFASFYNLRADKRYLKYISGTLQNVAQQLRELKEYRPFLKLLEDNKLLERSFEP